MEMKRRRMTLVLLLVGALLYTPRALFNCGPYFETAFFTYSLHPDFPLDAYARGELGILQPTYARSYLYVAYRHLIGTGFDSEEQKALLALWSERISAHSLDSFQEYEAKGHDWMKRWLAAREKVPQAGPAPRIELYRPVSQGSYQSFLNCTDDAFRTAMNTLDKRIEQFGSASPQVKDWLQAQDQVFSNCGGESSQVRVIPKALEPGAQPRLQADRT